MREKEPLNFLNLGLLLRFLFIINNLFGLEEIVVSGGAVTGFVRDESVSSYTPKPAPCPHAFLHLKTLPH